MKNIHTLLCASALAAIIPPSLFADTLTYNNNESGNGSFYSENDWTNSGGRPAQPDENSDIVFTGTNQVKGWVIDATGGVPINSLTDTLITQRTASGPWGCSLNINIGENLFKVKNDVLIASNHYYAHFGFNGTGDVEIGGNMTLQTDTQYKDGGAESYIGSSKMLNSFTVAKDFNQGTKLYINAKTFTVKGVFNATYGGSSNSDTLYLSYNYAQLSGQNLVANFGGLNGTNITLRYGGNNGIKDSTATINFTNSGVAKFKGALMYSSDKNTSNVKHYLVMDKSATGTQYFENTESNGVSFDKVTVNSGTLKYSANTALSMQSDFEVNGGTLSAATIDNEVEYLHVRSLAWSGGTLAFDIGQNGEFDVIDTAINFSKASVEGAEATRNITLDAVDGFDLAAWLDSNGGEQEFSIIRFGATDLTAADIVAKSLVEGVNIKSLKVTAKRITVTLTTAVPEPATIAAILGALALAVAAVRRRK